MTKSTQIDKIIRCPRCRRIILRGIIMKAKVTRFEQGIAHVKCNVCKTWVKVPQVRLIQI